MRSILFFVNSFGKGGAERVCVNLGEEYVKQGYNVCFITLFENSSYIESNTKFNICNLKLDEKMSKLELIDSIFRAKKNINSFVKKNYGSDGYALISAHLPLSHICASLSIVKKECLYVQHTSLLQENRHRIGYDLFYKFKNNVCVSEGLKREMKEKMGIKKLECIYNPIDLQRIYELRQNSIGDISKPYILVVGRLIQTKRFDRAIKIFKKGEFYKKYDLYIIGEGELKSELIKLTNKLELQHSVKFLGWQNNVYKWMNKAELVLQTSDREAFPMILIEALASGTKVVASDAGIA